MDSPEPHYRRRRHQCVLLFLPSSLSPLSTVAEEPSFVLPLILRKLILGKSLAICLTVIRILPCDWSVSRRRKDVLLVGYWGSVPGFVYKILFSVGGRGFPGGDYSVQGVEHSATY